jgi:hypothetical protein
MRHFYDLPQDDGSRRIHRCPPSHHEMALPPHLAQASARAPQPSHPTTDRTMLLVQVSPSQQRGVIGHGILAGKYLAEYRDLLK